MNRANFAQVALGTLSLVWTLIGCTTPSSDEVTATGGSASSVSPSPSGGKNQVSTDEADAGGSAEASNGGRRSSKTTSKAAAGGAPATTSDDDQTLGGQTGSRGGSVSGGRTGSSNRTGTVVSGGSSSAGGSRAMTAAGSDAGGSAAVRFVGRVDQSDPAKPRFAWSGTGVVARFEGTSVSVHLSGSQFYTVLLDGKVKNASAEITGTVMLAEGLDAGEHTIELYRRTEADRGDVQFLGFDFGGGALLSPPPAPERRLEIVGDSITCGYGNEGADETCTFSPETENHYLSYGAIAARNLGAELNTIAWSGKGVVCNYGDDAASCTNPMPTYYDRTLPRNTSSQWDFSAFQPDAVIVNLGTNDFSTNDDPTQPEFEQAYRGFLEHIRSKNPDAFILCTNGPMLTGTDLTTAQSYITNVVKALNDAGDIRVGTFDIPPQDRANGLGCDWHPSLTTHEMMAAELESALKAALGW